MLAHPLFDVNREAHNCTHRVEEWQPFHKRLGNESATANVCWCWHTQIFPNQSFLQLFAVEVATPFRFFYACRCLINSPYKTPWEESTTSTGDHHHVHKADAKFKTKVLQGTLDATSWFLSSGSSYPLHNIIVLFPYKKKRKKQTGYLPEVKLRID